MPIPDEILSPKRLFQATEAVLDAVCELAVAHEGGYISPESVLGSEHEPESLWDFSDHEVSEALRFLERLGYLPAD